jgi:hypothetical protein
MTPSDRVPTYAPDVAGPIRRWDERDVLFARHDLHRLLPIVGHRSG